MIKKLGLLLTLLPSLLFSQHNIQGVFSPAKEFTYAFLYHATPTGANYVNRCEISPDGSFTIPLDSTASAGIYKIVYALPPEENNFDFIYNGKEDISLNFSLVNGLEFTSSSENKLWSSYTKEMTLINAAINDFYEKGSTNKKEFKTIFKTLKDIQNAYENDSKSNLAFIFIKANRMYVPEKFEDLSTYSKNLKSNYLKHIDFNNPLLQSSDFLINRVLSFVFELSETTNNTIYKTNVDHLMTSIGDGNQPLKTILLEMIWFRFSQLENEVVANYISDTYLLELAEKTNYPELAEQLIIYKNNALGMTASNFDLAITIHGETETTTLHDLNIAEQYLIVFWSSTCGHCVKELPKIRDILAKKPNLKIIAFGLEHEAEGWQKEIGNYPNFIHVLGLQKWDNTVVKSYGVKSTPSYFLLDKNKKIIAKPFDVEALEKYFEAKPKNED